MTSETRTVRFNVDPALNAYLAWIAEAGREFDLESFDLFAAGYRARTDGDAAQAEVARLRAALTLERDLVQAIYSERHNTGELPRQWWRKRGERAMKLVCTYCPFCGVEYDAAAEQQQRPDGGV